MTQIVGIGMDVVEIDRIRGVFARFPERFLRRVYTAEERRRVPLLRDPAPYLAGRWAVKESVFKVLGTGLAGGITWQDVAVLRAASGAPSVVLRGRALERAREIGVGQILVTITHGRDLAIAQALGIGGSGPSDPAAAPDPAEG
jgi:holo-[acyl-carrier protein] synthase